MSGFRASSLMAVLAATIALAVAASSVDAAPRFNAGSRGMRTFSTPPPTATAPRAAQPIQHSMTVPSQYGSPSVRPNTATFPTGGLFGRPGLLGGLAAGFLGAGLFGMLFGNGLLGGLGSFASLLGLLLQIGVVVIVARMAWAWWQRQQRAAFAGAGGRNVRPFEAPNAGPSGATDCDGSTGHGAPTQLKSEDFDSFERTLGEVQTAYSHEDLAALRERVTPEMLSYYAEELASNAARGIRNEITDVKLLQGDLAEAWREGNDEFATVAMRYQLTDTFVDRNSGRVAQMSGGSEESIEYWTFRRTAGGPWMVSAIQQAA